MKRFKQYLTEKIDLRTLADIPQEELKQQEEKEKQQMKELAEKMKNLPKMFQRTHYRLPNDEDLEDIDKHNLTADEIVNGFYYTIVGKGMESKDNVDKIIEAIKLLIKKYPKDVYKNALDIAKQIKPWKPKG